MRIKFKPFYRLILLLMLSLVILVLALSYRLVRATSGIVEAVKEGNIYKQYNVNPPVRYTEVKSNYYNQNQ